MTTATLTFDRDTYGPGDTIGFTVTVDAPMAVVTAVHGTVETPGGVLLPADSTTTVHGLYGPFTAAGYTIVQDPEDPATFTATPVDG